MGSSKLYFSSPSYASSESSFHILFISTRYFYKFVSSNAKENLYLYIYKSFLYSSWYFHFAVSDYWGLVSCSIPRACFKVILAMCRGVPRFTLSPFFLGSYPPPTLLIVLVHFWGLLRSMFELSFFRLQTTAISNLLHTSSLLKHLYYTRKKSQ